MLPLTTFLSYSHEDRRHRNKLRDHFAPLKRSGLITLWDDCELQVGDKVDSMIQEMLARTDVIILLVSPGFLSSEYVWSIEMKRALDRHKAGYALMLPIVTMPCGWKETPLGELVVAPTDGKPISSWDPRDAGWADATRLTTQALVSYRQKRFGSETVDLPLLKTRRHGRGWRRVLDPLKEMLEGKRRDTPAPARRAPEPVRATPPLPVEPTEREITLEMAERPAPAPPPAVPAEKTGLFEISLPPLPVRGRTRTASAQRPVIRKPAACEQVHHPAVQASAGGTRGASTALVEIAIPPFSRGEVTQPEAVAKAVARSGEVTQPAAVIKTAPQPGEVTQPEAVVSIAPRVIEVTEPGGNIAIPAPPPPEGAE